MAEPGGGDILKWRSATSAVRQAGAIAVRHRDGRPEVLVVRAKKNPSDWIFPKGHIDPGEDAPTAAVRELLEEGGVIGHAADCVGVSTFTQGARHVQVAYYLVWFDREGEAEDNRERAWLSFAEARLRLTFEDARGFLDVIVRLLTSPPR